MFIGERGKILIVEDDEFMLRALERFCANYSSTIAVATFRDAVNAIGQNLVAVVLDVHLPDGSGITFLEKIRERDPRVPVLVLTGDVSTWIVDRARALGAEFLSKIDDSSRLKSFLRRAVNSSRYAELHSFDTRVSNSHDSGPRPY